LDQGQIHDFNPGFGPAVDATGSNGFGDRVFWTTAIPDSDVTVNLGAGTAEMQVNNLAMGDYFTKASAFGPNWATAFVPATVSFDVVWSAPVTRRLTFQDSTNIDQFGGAFVENRATVTWSGTNANGFTFTANPGDFSTSFDAFAELARVQNGIFFDAGQDASDAVGKAVSRTASVLADSAAIVAALPGSPPRTLPPPGRTGSPDPLSSPVSAALPGNPSGGSGGAAAFWAAQGGMPVGALDQLFADGGSGSLSNGWANDLALAH